MTTQREKDIEASGMKGEYYCQDEWFADGAEYARRELFERLLNGIDDLTARDWVKSLAKEYVL